MHDVVIGELSADFRNADIFVSFEVFLVRSWRTCRLAGTLKIGPRH